MKRRLSGAERASSNGNKSGALLPDGFALREWPVLAEPAGQSPIGERRILGRNLPYGAIGGERQLCRLERR